MLSLSCQIWQSLKRGRFISQFCVVHVPDWLAYIAWQLAFPQIKLNSSWFCASLEKVFFELNNWSCQESRKFTIRDFVDCLRFHILKTSVKLNCNLLGTTLFSIIKSFTTKKLQRSRYLWPSRNLHQRIRTEEHCF